MKKKKSNNYLFILSLLLFLFLMPLIVAVILFNKNPYWLHQQTVNKGALISTEFNLQQLELMPAKTPLHSFKYHWLLFYLTTSPCSKLCQKNLYLMRQIRVALGKYRHQVNYGLILTKENRLDFCLFANKDTRLLSYIISKQHFKEIFSLVKSKNHNPAYFIADPFGRIILYYPNDTSGKDIYEDLMRLLTISTTG